MHTPEIQNPFVTADDAVSTMTDYQCRLTLKALLGRLIGDFHDGDATAAHEMLIAVAWDNVVMWDECNIP